MNITEGLMNLWNSFKAQNASEDSSSPNKQAVIVKAPMTCIVLKVLVTAGSKVAKNDVLFVIEAMEMETKIKSPIAGIVQVLGVSEGNKIEASQMMAIIDKEVS